MKTFNFPATSRYYGIETVTLKTGNGPVVYLQRRFLPAPEKFALLQLHNISQGERMDLIASKYMNDAEAFWRIADANAAMNPEDLTGTPGRTLRITLPEGIPGTPNA
ncbi:MAG: LysM domain-containing protein [Acidobacteriia bacterium]|nr:LysM domain-containing protein [Terriglobia bacterium]